MSKSIAGFSCGDINGVGLEVFLKAFSHESLFRQVTPVLFVHKEILRAYSEELELELPTIQVIGEGQDLIEGVVNLVEPQTQLPELRLGTPDTTAGKYAVSSLQKAIAAVKSGLLPNIVTLPFDKNTVQSSEFRYPGHTEMLAAEFEVDDHMMILVGEDMRVGVVTGHIPLKDVASILSGDLIDRKISTLLNTLRQDFGVAKPKIAVLGLNPHAGDDGLIGLEEIDLLEPVIDKYRKKGEVVIGPFPADGFFGSRSYLNFDAVLAMYHDQGLIPFKYANFHSGTNYTAGLPIIRTSPDHGTAFDIAGKGVADPSSLVHSIFTMNSIYRKRLEYFELNKNPLDFIRHKREKFSIGAPNLK
ncbi:MAG: 4-hydroxythreonine-4-phosphate dehydrogenase PdxA [Flavobacteriales bacterium]|nr:4-hydroxythreonine-4-phosphate dehydrogenase PdxA [Flavobacteriales bacterium]